MHPVTQFLEKRLIAAGWCLAASGPSDAWWADESWRLESGDDRAVITFLVDPQADLHRRKKGEAIWAVKASPAIPAKWQKDEQDVVLDLGKNWRARVPAFVESLARFRKKAPNKAPEPTP